MVPPFTETGAMIVRDETKRRVPECDDRLVTNFLQPVLQVRCHWIRHEQRTADFEQCWLLDRLHDAPEVPVVAAEIAEPAPAWPCLERHAHRRAIRSGVQRSHLFKQCGESFVQ